MYRTALYLILLVTGKALFSQTQTFREKGKWGIRDKDNILIQPLHDTVFNFDSTGRICLVCARSSSTHPNKYIKTPIYYYNCSYLNKNGERLTVRSKSGDSSSVFSLHKATVAHYIGNNNRMSVEVGNEMHLVDKNFRQVTFEGYDEVYPSAEPALIIAGKKNAAHALLMGVINEKEEIIIPFRYTGVKVNPVDSLIIGCTAGMGANSDDDVYDYNGKKIASYHRHVEVATRHYVVHRIFHPEEYLLIVNLQNKEERREYAQQVQRHSDHELLMMNENHWFTYDVVTHKKKAFDHKQKK